MSYVAFRTKYLRRVAALEHEFAAKQIATPEYVKKMTELTGEMKAWDDELLYGTTLPLHNRPGWVSFGIGTTNFDKLKSRVCMSPSDEVPHLDEEMPASNSVSVYTRGKMICVVNTVFAQDIHYTIIRRTDTDFKIQFI